MTQQVAMSGTTAGELAARLRALHQDALPPAVIAATKDRIIDTLASGWAGGRAPEMQGLLDSLLQEGGAPQATLWFFGGALPVRAATFLNGALAASLEYDSLHEAATVHADIVVVPAALAAAEARHASGAELISAVALGTELICRLGLAADSTKGWFYTSIFGGFGASAAVGLLLGLDTETLANALGIALSQAAGTQQPHRERRLTKRLQSAFAAQAGVFSAQLAAAGITGPNDPFAGPYGLFALYEAGDARRALSGFGDQFVSLDTSFKKFPCCACNHAAIDAAMQMMAEHRIGGHDVESAEVRITPYSNRLIGAPFDPGPNPQVTGQFSVQYAVAATLMRGHFTLDDIEPEAVCDPAVGALARQIHVHVEPSWTERLVPAELSIQTRDGRALTQRVQVVPGGPAAPLGAAAVQRKIEDCFLGGPSPLPRPAFVTLQQRLAGLEHLDDMAQLFRGVI
jgi:2-methylcitrate dehydratase PrpD